MQTTDIKLAATLMTYGFTLDSVEKISMRTAEFQFAYHKDIDSVISDYTNGNLSVDAVTLLQNLEKLKSRAADITRI
jgi:hypothetical protein